MSKSKKRKSSKGNNTGTQLGALALIISIGALGLGVYQFIAPPASEGPQIYSLSHEDIIYIDGVSYFQYLYSINIDYNTKVGDIVVLEFSCLIYLDPQGSTTFAVYFSNNGTTPTSSIYLDTDFDFTTSGYMKHTFEATTAGENHLVIWVYIDDEGTNTNIRDSILTVTVYG